MSARFPLTATLTWVSLLLWGAGGARTQVYPLSPTSLCGSVQTCLDVLEQWNQASRADLVDENFNTGPLSLAAVRWYKTEGQCTGSPLCDDQLNDGDGACPILSSTASKFCGVTDELSNVLLSHAMGANQDEYQKLHNFTELLRHPSANGLQCWKYYVHGVDLYDSYQKLCVTSDSASDASLRILHAYAIACAKQTARIWKNNGVDYCADYVEQGNAIWGLGTAQHGEIKHLANGEYFLANGFNNQPGSPVAADSFRPDYYELQALMDFALYIGNPALRQGVLDMLEDYRQSLGDNGIHCGKTGHFDAATTLYTCDQLCSPPYMNNADTWRAIPALSSFLLVHGAMIPSTKKSQIFDKWWSLYAGGNSQFGPEAMKPFEIYCNSAQGVVRQAEDSYKTLSMWIPLGATYSGVYTAQAIGRLVDIKYDWTGKHFFGAAYYGGYFSQFAQRAIGEATGMIDPRFWSGSKFSDGFESGDFSAWSGRTP